MMNRPDNLNKPIVFFDSGIGGLPYLDLAHKRLPSEYMVYIADRTNFPYGEKAKEEVIKAVLSSVDKVVKELNPRLIVIACNTASVLALKELRRSFKVPFIGVVPAVKPAAKLSKIKRIGLMATRKTIEDGYLDNLIKDFAGDCKVIKVKAGELVRFVEWDYITTSKSERIKVVRKALKSLFKNNGPEIDTVVLACTHFLFLKEEFKEVLGGNVIVIDSTEGVINRLIYILKKHRLETPLNGFENKLFVTGKRKVEQRYYDFALKFKLKVGGTL